MKNIPKYAGWYWVRCLNRDWECAYFDGKSVEAVRSKECEPEAFEWGLRILSPEEKAKSELHFEWMQYLQMVLSTMGIHWIGMHVLEFEDGIRKGVMVKIDPVEEYENTEYGVAKNLTHIAEVWRNIVPKDMAISVALGDENPFSS